MTSGQLRSHIPIAAPARREAADGAEPPLRVVLGFEPRWFRERCEVDFSQRWHSDPDYRRSTLIAMRNQLRRSFPEVSQWDGEEERHTATISGVFGIGVIPAAFGIPLRYYADRWPHLEPGYELGDRAAEQLTAEAALASPFVEGLLRQIDDMAAKWGTVYGDLNWQGVLNLAFHLRGQQIFADMAERPDLAAHLFGVIAEVLVRLAQTVQQRQRASGFDIDYMCLSNCTINMISPAMYGRILAPVDARVADSFARFGVHTCNWNATPYFPALSQLPKLGYIDMGMQSDLVKAKSLFPGARRAVMYTPGRLKEVSPDQLRADLERIWRELAPCDVVLADIPWDTPDETVRWFYGVSRQISETTLPVAAA